MKKILMVLLLLATSVSGIMAQGRFANKEDSLYIREHYTKSEIMVPVRDGVKLFTSIYTPKDISATKKYPIMLSRSPYSVAPYGADNYKTTLGPTMLFAKDGYIFVYQDVRGKFMSEGEFVAVRPHIPVKKSKTDVDESSDTYDTIEWLIKNLPNNNGNVGSYGISAPGFYATMTMIDAHPALKAASPQAPVTDWFMGDDRHHNGAFFFMGTFSFLSSFGVARPVPTTKGGGRFTEYNTPDAYQFYQGVGPVKNINEKYLKNENAIWNEMMDHESYDEFWQSRTPVPHLKNIKPAVMTVGGWFDQEDLYGPLKTYAGIEKNNPKSPNTLIMGPWIHGGWVRSTGEFLGNIRFEGKNSQFYQEKIEFPFFSHYLKGTPNPELPKAYIFDTGVSTWTKYDQWPPKGVEEKKLYLLPNGKLAFTPAAATTKETFDEYTSDPKKPVPFTSEISIIRGADFMYEDQRFAGRRPDVVVYESDILTEDVSIAGSVMATLVVSTTGTDADYVVKLIDVYPDNAPNNSPRPGTQMGGFQLLVRGEVMRAKFRNSFSKPEAMVPNKKEKVKFDMQDAAHTFKKGHKIMVQVQSTWFPLVDVNPQKFVNIYKAKAEDFQVAKHRIYTSGTGGSYISVQSPGK